MTDPKNWGSLIIFLAVVLYSLFKVINGLRRGRISYGGNRIQFKSQTYTRKEQPFAFWAGIVAFSFPLLILLLGLLVGYFEG